MKKILLLAISLSFLALPAQAGNEGGAFIGGLIGGIILNDALNNHRHHHRPPKRSYYYEDYNYYSSCWTEVRREWDPYARRYYKRYVRYCD